MDVLQHKLVFVVETFSISLLVISKHVSRYPFSCQVEFLRVHSVAEQSSSVRCFAESPYSSVRVRATGLPSQHVWGREGAARLNRPSMR